MNTDETLIAYKVTYEAVLAGLPGICSYIVVGKITGVDVEKRAKLEHGEQLTSVEECGRAQYWERLK